MSSAPWPFPDVIDSTMRADFVSCPTRFMYARGKNLHKEGTNVHLHFGACLARGLEAYRRSFWSLNSPHPRSEPHAFAAGCRAVVVAWGDYENTPLTGSAGNKTLDTCLETIATYGQKFNPQTDEFTPHILPDGEPMVECTFALPIPGIIHPQHGGPVLYAGRYDMLAVSRSGGFYVEDDKTTSQLGDQWIKQWKLRGQFSGYAWSLREMDINLAGVVIRGFGILKREITVAQVIESRPNWLIDKWLNQMQRDVRRMISLWQVDEWDQSFDHACSEYGGCPYLPLCTTQNPSNWEGQYVVKKWDPLSKEIPR